MTKTSELVAFTIRLSAEEREALAARAAAAHRSVGSEARVAVIAHLERTAEEQAA